MKSPEKEKSSYEEYLERLEWVKETAKEFGIGQDGEHFIIEVEGKDGKPEKVYISARHKIPLKTSEKGTPDYIPVEDVIEAIKEFHPQPLKKALEMLKEKRAKEKSKK